MICTHRPALIYYRDFLQKRYGTNTRKPWSILAALYADLVALAFTAWGCDVFVRRHRRELGWNPGCARLNHAKLLRGARQRRKCFPVGCSVSRIDLWDHSILKTINHNTSQYPVNMSVTINLLCLTQVGRLELPLHISQIRIKSWSSRCCRELAIRQSLSKGSLDKDRRKPQ